jgi:hypothetical protein
METLVSYLIQLEKSLLPDVTEDIYLLDIDHPHVQMIRNLASDFLIKDDGTPDFDQIDHLYHTYGYFIFPGERDRYGWLSACLRTTKGLIVFG